ncbi:MAG: hypothetical protein IPK10_04260 [Bacteroidetes bacterium]|nr:hypothetical protein [Bacteroidota bacterium]
MKSTYLNYYLVGILFILSVGCSQPKAGKNHPPQNKNTSSTSSKNGDNSNSTVTNSSTSGSTTTPTTSNNSEPSKSTTGTPSSGNKSSLPKNWPWRGICFQSENSDAADVAYLASIGVNFLRIQMKPVIRAKRKNLDPKQCF